MANSLDVVESFRKFWIQTLDAVEDGDVEVSRRPSQRGTSQLTNFPSILLETTVQIS